MANERVANPPELFYEYSLHHLSGNFFAVLLRFPPALKYKVDAPAHLSAHVVPWFT
jgi:hypothetical protein